MSKSLQEQAFQVFMYSNSVWYNIALTIFYGITAVLFIGMIVGITRRKRANQPLKITHAFLVFLGLAIIPFLLLLILRIAIKAS